MNKTINQQIKFISRNPFVYFANKRFLSAISYLVRLSGAKQVLDCGCGEGIVAKVLLEKNMPLTFCGFDIDQKSLKIAKTINPKARFGYGSIYKIPYANRSFPLVLCTEVLEHLKSPKKALAELREVTSKFAIISVPCEPFFRLSNILRLKYLKKFGSTPGHINHWTISSFKKLLEPNFIIVKETYPFPWMIFLVKIRK